MTSTENDVTMDFTKIPLTALGDSARNILSQSLDLSKVLPTREGYPRDWRGIVHLAGLPVQSKKMRNILQQWSTKDIEMANFDFLVRYLQMIDRWDVVDDLANILIQDAQVFLTSSCMNETDITTIQENAEPNMAMAMCKEEILTTDDAERALRGLPPQRYNAFLLFAKADEDYAIEMINRLEKNQGFKFCLKNRNILGGGLKHDTILNIITNRCDCVVAIISNAFLRSPTKEFIVNYATALQIEERKLKIVPCITEKCQLPLTLRHSTKLYYQSSLLVDFWERLKTSIQKAHMTSNNENSMRPGPSIQSPVTISLPAQPAAIKDRPCVSEQTPSDCSVSEHTMPLGILEVHTNEANLSQVSNRRKFKWYSKFPWWSNGKKVFSSKSTNQRKGKTKKGGG